MGIATAAESGGPHHRRHAGARAGNRSKLSVDVRKRAAGFELGVEFAGGGKPLGILGASGSGKSMTLRCIAGLERADSGRIVLNGRVLFDSAKGICLPPEQRRVGIVFQDYALFPNMTVRENIEFSRRGRAEEWAGRAHVEDLLDRYPDQLSGGSGSAWRWRGRWPWSRRRCCSTSRYRRSIRTCGGRWRNSFATC